MKICYIQDLLLLTRTSAYYLRTWTYLLIRFWALLLIYPRSMGTVVNTVATLARSMMTIDFTSDGYHMNSCQGSCPNPRNTPGRYSSPFSNRNIFPFEAGFDRFASEGLATRNEGTQCHLGVQLIPCTQERTKQLLHYE